MKKREREDREVKKREKEKKKRTSRGERKRRDSGYLGPMHGEVLCFTLSS